MIRGPEGAGVRDFCGAGLRVSGTPRPPERRAGWARRNGMRGRGTARQAAALRRKTSAARASRAMRAMRVWEMTQ